MRLLTAAAGDGMMVRVRRREVEQVSGRDSYRGCLVAGAAGDALGYAVEFMGEAAIFGRYGEKGITGYELTHGKALISDDTQMTLFTAEGLLRAAAAGKAPGDVKGFAACVNEAYLDWLATQEEPYRPAAARGGSRLSGVPELYARRAPGGTCLSALRAGGGGTADRPINNSKGCGGVMRAAPVGLLQGAGWSDEDVCRLGAEAAAATHGHPLGWMSAAALALIVRAVSQSGAGVRDAALGALDTLNAVYADRPERAGFTRLIERPWNWRRGTKTTCARSTPSARAGSGTRRWRSPFSAPRGIPATSTGR